ncbi:MAG: hypothetical protein NXI30_08315 [bacterium]|nr:hypothetical protein [bacterium]
MSSSHRRSAPSRLAAPSVLVALAMGLAACAASPPQLALDAPTPAEQVRGEIYHAEDEAAPVVTLQNLPRSERFWPHQIQLTTDWKPEGWEGDFGWGMGVVIEVDDQSRIRVDFSRFGKHWIPAEVTDVVARANQIRTGESVKFKPNLVLALGNRLLDPTGRTLAESSVDLLAQNAFVLVFADPRDEGFPDLVASLSPLFGRERFHCVLLPQGGHPDFHVWKAVHDAGWKGSFLLDRFSPAYTEGFLESGTALPRVEVRSPEGRRVWQGGAGDVAEIEGAFGT